MYFIIVAFFAVRANVMFISWRVQMSELNWEVLRISSEENTKHLCKLSSAQPQLFFVSK